MTPPDHIALFDLHTGGHHGQYVHQAVDFWGRHRLPGRLDVVVPDDFAEMHPDVAEVVAAHEAAGVHLRTVDLPVRLRTHGRGVHLHNGWVHERVLHRVLRRLRPDHLLSLYLDPLLPALALGRRPGFPATISGIYFRPPFALPEAGAHRGATPRIKRGLLRAALRNPHLGTLFCLDPAHVPPINALAGRDVAVALPDGVTPLPPRQPREATRAAWGLTPGRRVALFFGSIAARKGIFETLAALETLPPALQQQLALVCVGAVVAVDAERVYAAVAHARQATDVQIILEDRFVAEEDVQDVIRAADLVLMPYRGHAGSSGVLVRAAHAGRPILATDYGLIGRHLRAHRLGAAVEGPRPEALGDKLRQWLAAPETFPFDAADARRFADAHSADAFAATLFRRIGRTIG